ncbi:dynamin family protein [Streptomyces sp. NPDC001795]|uniref:dynamin family protein n=1 Tax=Streptomyces sp. NPDC001795 TaxID=3154525 RepID=UPI00332F7E2F
MGELTRCASDATGLIELLTRHQLGDGDSDITVRQAQRRALEALHRARESAQAPFSIGLTGEMSAGKSLLLGVLLGMPELLPVGEEAVTGNVTLIHAKAAPPQTRESFESAVRVEYFSPAQTVEYVQHLRNEMADQAEAAGLDHRVAEQLRHLPLHEPDCGELIRFRDTYLGGALARPLAGVLQELRSVDAALAAMREYGRSLLGVTAELDHELARAALVLPGADEGRLRDPRAGWTAHTAVGTAPSAALLRATLPLIRRVVREIQVPPSVWDLTAFPGAELRFLDFPGLNSDFSAVRDQYVCGAEMHSVHSLLILLNAGGGAKDTPRRIVRMWHAAQRSDAMEDSVIALISRFHDLRVSEAVMDPFVRAEESPTRERLLSGVPVLRDLLASAERLVTSPRQGLQAPGDRIVFTSAMRALSAGHRPERIGKDFVDKCDLENQLPRADRWADIWGGIGRRLAADPLAGGLDRMLSDFARDGGVERLRQCLGAHVTRHGAALQLRRFAGHRVAASDSLRDLHTALEAYAGRSRIDHRAETEVRRRLIALQSVWSDVRERAATELLDARRLHPGGTGDPPGATLFGELERDTAERVYTWRSWRSLLDTVHDEHVDPRRLHGGHSAPVRTEEFFAEFRDSCHESETAGAARLLSAVEAWLLTYQQDVMARARELGTVVTQEAFERLRSGPDGDRLVALLRRATTLQWLRDEAEKALRDNESADGQTDETELREHFPLRIGHMLPWHPDSPFDTVADSAARHQTAIARHRREMAAMVLRQSLAGLVRRQRLVAAHLQSEVGSFLTEFQQAALAGALITAVAGATDGDDGLTVLAEQLRLRARDSAYTWQPSLWGTGSGGPGLWPDAGTGPAEHGSVFHMGTDGGDVR